MTSSGRSATSRTISLTSGWFCPMALGDLLDDDGLAGARRGDDEAALPLADRRDEVHDAHIHVLRVGLEAQALLRIERGELVERDFLVDDVGRLVVDRLDAQQREVPLAVLRRADLPLHDRAGLDPEPPDLRGRDVDVVRAGQVVVIGRPEEAEAVGQHFEHAFAVHQAVLAAALFQDFEEQVLLVERGILGDVLALGGIAQFLDRHVLQVRDEQPVAALALGRRPRGLFGRFVLGGAVILRLRSGASVSA